MVFKAFELAAFLNKLLLTQLTWCFTAVPVLPYLNLDLSPIEVSGNFATDSPGERAGQCFSAFSSERKVRPNTALEKHYLIHWILLRVSFVML